jgi:RimJ/RimL family protein N-acetyltransferase
VDPNPDTSAAPPGGTTFSFASRSLRSLRDADLAPRLEGRLAILEPLAERHADGLYEAARPTEIWEWWPFNPATDRARFDAWFAGVLDEVRRGDTVRFATLDAGTGDPVGSTSYCTLRPDHRGLEIGWTWLTPSAWGTGLNAEAKLLQLRHAFDTLGCQRVEFETDEQNQRSRRALEALPATLEGVLRDYKRLDDGRRRSSALYSILDSEWPGVRMNLERRIDIAGRRSGTRRSRHAEH